MMLRTKHAPPWLLAACLAACATTPSADPSAPAAAPAAATAPAWELLVRELPGDWQAQLGETTITVSYRMSARDSVIVETWMPGTAAETLTTYHLDGARLMLTHYCGQGNQPRLQLVKGGAREVEFSRFDVSDLGADESALAELALRFEGAELVRDEIYARGAERERTTLRFVRVASDAAESARSTH